VEKHFLEHSAPLLITDVVECEDGESRILIEIERSDPQIERTFAFVGPQSDHTLPDIPATPSLRVQDGLKRPTGFAKSGPSALTVCILQVDTVEGLANPHSQKRLLLPITEDAKPLAGRDNLLAFIHNDHQRRQGIQEPS
jgi:hypothetical protein